MNDWKLAWSDIRSASGKSLVLDAGPGNKLLGLLVRIQPRPASHLKKDQNQ